MTTRSTLTNQLKQEHVGVELEFSHLSQDRAMAVLASHFAPAGELMATIHHGGHLSEQYVYDAQGRKWSLVSDGSIVGNGAELVTPVLGYDDIEDLQVLVRELREAGARSNHRDYHCGVHIHVDFRGHTPHSLRMLQNLYASHERLINKAVAVSSDRQRGYAHLIEPSWLRALNTSRYRDMDSFKRAWYGYNSGYDRPVSQGEADSRGQHKYDNSRYHAVNFHAIWCHNTIEFRLFEFHRGIHAGELKAWIQFCMAINAYSKVVSRAPYAERATDNDKFAMRNWLLNMGLVGDEFKTCRKHLTKRLTGDSAYRNGRPVHTNGVDLDDRALDSTNIREV